LLERLSRENGVTTVLVTHDDRILDIADRIFRIEDGQLSETGKHRCPQCGRWSA